MNVLIVYAHPEPKSFNGAMLERAVRALEAQGHAVEVSDLYAQGFNPVSGPHNFSALANPDFYKQQDEERHASTTNGFAPDVQAEIEKLSRADLLIFQFPLWWFSVPAILKGWVDRVFAFGVAYGDARWYDNGVFKGRRAMLSLTTGASQAMFSPRGMHGDIEQILFPIHHGMLAFVGFDVLPPFIAWSASHGSDEERHEVLNRYEEQLRNWQNATPIAYHSLSDYDEEMQMKEGLPALQ